MLFTLILTCAFIVNAQVCPISSQEYGDKSYSEAITSGNNYRNKILSEQQCVRDLASQNFLMSLETATREINVLDFGLTN